jgi:hypothetical protein
MALKRVSAVVRQNDGAAAPAFATAAAAVSVPLNAMHAADASLRRGGVSRGHGGGGGINVKQSATGLHVHLLLAVLCIAFVALLADTGGGWYDDACMRVAMPSLSLATRCTTTAAAAAAAATAVTQVFARSMTSRVQDSTGTNGGVSLDWREQDLTGTIPTAIGQLTAAQVLIIFGNTLRGTLPKEIGRLVNCIYLWANNNAFTGTIPPEIGGMTALQGMALFNNKLTGSLPPEISKMTKLKELNMYVNKLIGTIPRELGEMVALTRLYVWQRDVVFFVFFSEIARCSSPFVSITLQYTCSLPNPRSALCVIRYLNNNKFTGPIPGAVTKLVSLLQLRLSPNAGLCRRIDGVLVTNMCDTASPCSFPPLCDTCAESDCDGADWSPDSGKNGRLCRRLACPPNTETCCQRNQMCSAFSCAPYSSKKAAPPTYCSASVCSNRECCDNHPTCDPTICLGDMVSNDRVAPCANFICDKDECCNPAPNVVPSVPVVSTSVSVSPTPLTSTTAPPAPLPAPVLPTPTPRKTEDTSTNNDNAA